MLQLVNWYSERVTSHIPLGQNALLQTNMLVLRCNQFDVFRG